MTDESTETVPARHAWLKKLALGFALLAVLLVVLYFVASSGPFLRSVVLPRVGKAGGFEITAGEVSLSPFSELQARKVELRRPGREPLAQIEELRVRYSLWSMLGGDLQFGEVTLTAPALLITQAADGSSNLDAPKPAGPPAAGGSSTSDKALRLSLEKLALKRGRVQFRQVHQDGSQLTAELENLETELTQLGNDKSGRLTLAASLQVRQTAKSQPDDQAAAKFSGNFEFDLDPRLLPKQARGKARLDIGESRGAFAGLARLGGQLEVELSPTELRQLALSFDQDGKQLGQVRLAGPLDVTKREGRLRAEILSVDRQVLNLFGAARRWDFADSVLNSSNLVDVSRGGKLISAKGQLQGRRLSVRQAATATPPLDLDLDYQASVNVEDHSAIVHKLTAYGRQNGAELLRLSLDRPMTLSWGKEQRGFTEATLQARLTELRLEDWRSLLGTNAPGGTFAAEASVLAQKDGRLLRITGSGAASGLEFTIGTNRFRSLDVTVQTKLELENFRLLRAERFDFAVRQAGAPLAEAHGSANCDLESKDAGGEIALESTVPALNRLHPVPDLRADAGGVKFSGLFAQKQNRQTLSGNAILSDFTGRYRDYDFQNYQLTLDYDLEVREPVLNVRRLALTPRQGFEAGGSFDAAGQLDWQKNSGQFTYKAVALNQLALRPFLTPLLKPRAVKSVSLNIAGAANWTGTNAATASGSLELARLLVDDPEKKFPAVPLDVRFDFDASRQAQNMELRKLLLGLTPTARATNNSVTLSGRLDLRATNAAPSQLTLRSDTLDITTYYDLLVTKPQTNAAPKSAQPPAAAPGVEANAEPPALKLPLEQLAFDLNVSRLFLHELIVSNWTATAKLDRGRLNVEPLKLALNGSPIEASSKLNLNVPGYEYDVNFRATRVPAEPLVKSLAPDYAGKIQGDLNCAWQIRGAGVTGRNLRRNTTGQFALTLTNANIEVMNPQTKWGGFLLGTVKVIATVLGVPELTKSPLTNLVVDAQLKDGRLDVRQAAARSESFRADIRGGITLTDVLTNSPLDLPVTVALKPSLSQKLKVLPQANSTNADYVPLPQFLKIAGTLSNPKSETDKLVLAGITVQGVAGAAGSRVGGVLQGVGNLLQGGVSTIVTNVVPGKTNAPTIPNPFHAIGDLLKPKK